MADNKVQRYDLKEMYDGREFTFASMEETDDGLYVKHEEYAKLEAELRASEKPEDAWKRGQEHMQQRCMYMVSEHRGYVERIEWMPVAPYVAPPSLPTEKE